MAGLGLGLLGKIKWFTAAVKATKVFKALKFIGTIAFWTAGVKGFMQMRDMMSEHQSIMANKTAAGGKIPVIYGTRRVGSQIVFMDTVGRKNRDLYVVYALAVGECEEILGKTIEIGGNSILDEKIFKKGGYVGSDKITSGAGSLCTADQNGDTNAGVGGGLGTDPTKRYQFVFNLHHGADSQTADPMLRASIPTQWSTNHKLNGICYIAAHFHYSKTGVFQGVPQITVQVKGKKVYDPRESGHTFGDPSTYEWSSNPALCYLDYITNDSYGKGLAESDINMSTFESAADVCDVEVDQPYYNGSYQNVTWSGTSGDDFIVISDNDDWYQNKTDEIFDLRDNGGTNVFTGAGITGVQRHQFYDDDQVNKIFINETLTSTYTNEAGSARAKVKRFHCNGYINTNKTVMENAKELLTNMRGIFTYINGKYELQIEDTGTSTFSITDDHIISDTGISIDYGDKDKKANKVIIEFFNSQTGYELDTATVLHDATPEYYSDDGEILEVKAQFPLITDAYIAYNMGKAILTRSRNQMTMQFLGTPEMYKLNVGDIVDLTYAGLGLSGKVCRVESLELQSDGLVNVSLIEYFDVYTWEVPAQEEVKKLQKLPSKGAVHPPEATSIVFTDTDASAINRPTLTWTEPDDFDVKEFRVDVVDSSDNNVFSKIVDTPSVDLSFLPKASNYEASITAFNTLDVESEPVTKTFTIADDPVKTTEVEIGSETLSNIIDYGTVTGQSGNWFQINGRLDLEDRFIWNSNGDNYWALGTAGDDDVNLQIKGGANTLIQFKDQDNALGTVKLAFGDDVIGDYSHDFINLVADYTQGNHATDAKSIFYIKGNASDGDEASGDIAKFTFAAADGYGFPTSVLYGTTTTPILIAEDYIEIEQATAPSTTTDKLYNVSGTLYWNGGAVNTGAGDITSVTINTAGGGLTGGASFSSGDATFTLAIGTNIQGDKTFDDNVVIEGDLTVQGTTTTIDTTNLDVKDKNITLNYGTGDTSANADGAGITIQDAVNSTTDATILWDTTSDDFNFSHPISVTGNITSSNSLTSQSINVSSSGYGVIEVGGVSGAYIDLKRPNTDDYDLRLISFGTGGEIDTGSGDLVIKRQGSTRIATTSSGIDVTGDISIGTDSGDPFNSNAKIKIQDSGTAYIQIKTGTSNSGGLLVGDTADDFVGGFIYNNSTNHLSLYSNDNISLELDDNYDVNVYQGALKIGGTEVITSSANLTNIGTISSGAITASGLTVDTSTLVVDATNNRVGIGTTSPYTLLELSSTDPIIRMTDSDGVADKSIYEMRAIGASGFESLEFRSVNDANSVYNKLLVLKHGGNVGIGTDAPSEKLDVAGKIKTGGQIRSGSYLESFPSFSFVNDTDTGMFSDTANQLEFSTGGSSRLVIDSSGNVGIATTNPATTLTVAGSSANGIELDRNGADATQSARLFFDSSTSGYALMNVAGSLTFNSGSTAGSSSGTERMRIDSTGRVGIGCSADGDLEVRGTTVISGESDSVNSIHMGLSGTNRTTIQLDTADTTHTNRQWGLTNIAGDFYIGRHGLSVMTMLNNGNVGINKSNPSAKLHVDGHIYVDTGHAIYADFFRPYAGTLATYGSSTSTDHYFLGNVGIGTDSPARQFHVHDASASYLHLTNNTTGSTGSDGASISMAGTSLQISNRENGVLQMYTNGTERARIDSSGNAIFTKSGGAYLQLKDASAVRGAINVETSDGLVFTTGSSFAERMRIDSSGNVGIGLTNPSAYGKFVINGTSNQLAINASSGKSRIALFEGGTGRFYIDTLNGSDGLAFVDADGSSERMRIDSSGNVGIGTSPNFKLHVSHADQDGLRFTAPNTAETFIDFGDTDDNDIGRISYDHADNHMAFRTNNTERMRIDSSGNLLVSKTSSDLTTDGIELRDTGGIVAIRTNGDPLYLNRKSTDGAIATFAKDGSTVGVIGVVDADLTIYTSTSGHKGLRFGNGYIAPTDNTGTVTNNTTDLGLSSQRFKNLYLSGDIDAAGDISTNELVVDTIATIDGALSSGAATINGIITSQGNAAINDAQIGRLNFKNTNINASANPIRASIFGGRENSAWGGYLSFYTSTGTSAVSEKSRITSDGNFLIGKTTADNTNTGIRIDGGNDFVSIVRAGNPCLILNRTVSDGVIMQIRKDGTTKGQIGMTDSIASSSVYFSSGSSSSTGTGLKFVSAAGTTNIIPCRGDGTAYDNAVDLGSSGTRFDDIYATNGTIQTSDRNEKQDIQELSEAEQRVAVACKGLIRRYKFNSAVAEKSDDARYHFGIIAQDLQDAFIAEGLDAGDYGMFISETWTDEEGNEQTKLGVRYNELLAFIIATL